jgi:N-acetylglucosamine-6-sulfatase
MPTVQSKLVGRGVTFRNGFVVNSLCCPSRASLLTGRYSHSTGVYYNTGWRYGGQAFDDDSSLATWLHGAGYRTGFVGKYLNDYAYADVPPGWDRFVAFRWIPYTTTEPGYFDYELNVDGAYQARGSSESDYSTDVLAAQAENFIRASEGPLFLLFSPYAPHPPATPAPRHVGAASAIEPWRPPSYGLTDEAASETDELRKRQLESLLAVDDAVARILAALRETGRLANTLIVFTSDNGYLWGEHGLAGKRQPYEEAIRVPFVVRYDPLTAEARTDARLVTNIDLAPTVVEVAGGIRPYTDGRSLVPLLDGAATSWRSDFLVENTGPAACEVRTEKHAYIVYGDRRQQLFDLVADPYELVNLRADPAKRELLSTLRGRLTRLCRPKPPGLTGLPSSCLISGSSGADQLLGTAYFDLVCGRWGNDRIYVRDGVADKVYCGPGRDSVVVDDLDLLASDCERVYR